MLAEQSWATLQLTFSALALAWLLVLALTVLTTGRGRWVSSLASLAETLAAALPALLAGYFATGGVHFGLRWFPRPVAIAGAPW